MGNAAAETAASAATASSSRGNKHPNLATTKASLLLALVLLAAFSAPLAASQEDTDNDADADDVDWRPTCKLPSLSNLPEELGRPVPVTTGAGTGTTGTTKHVYPGVYVASSNLPRPLALHNLTEHQIVMNCVWDDPRVLGGNVIVPWSKFDPVGPGGNAGYGSRYDWTWVERQIDMWTSRGGGGSGNDDGGTATDRNGTAAANTTTTTTTTTGKKVNLLVWGVAQHVLQHVDGETATPGWVFERTDVPTIDDCVPADGKAEVPVTPVHNDATYRSLYQDALRAFYERYKRDPRVNYVRFGAGVGSENYPMNSAVAPNGPCRDVWTSRGGSVQDWIDHVVAMIEFFGSLQNENVFDRTWNDPDDPDDRTEDAKRNAPLVVSLNSFKEAGGTDDLPNAIFEAARIRRLGIGTQG